MVESSTDDISPQVAPTISNEYFSVAMLVDELRNEESTKRLYSVQQLSTIAKALGAARCREELIPFLTEFTDDDEGILIELANQLPGTFSFFLNFFRFFFEFLKCWFSIEMYVNCT